MAQSQSDERDLFDHLIAEFGVRGLDAVAFLQTAERLLAWSDETAPPRQAGAAAYCVREALKRRDPPITI
jgi:hypothetical protein